MPLKKYHNQIKRQLINRFAGGVDRLLDLACGRGGDLLKWADAGVGHVTGVDLSPGEIDEAKRRWAGMRASGQGDGMGVDFRVVDTLGTAPWAEPPQHDAVSCMFAAHYFFSSEASARQFLANVAANLKPGGVFFGTVPSGKRVMAAIKAGGSWPLVETPALRLEARWKGQASPFGAAYTCAIGDTVTAGAAGASAGSLEYLVFFSAFAGVAAGVGLEPLGRWRAPALEALLEPVSVGARMEGRAWCGVSDGGGLGAHGTPGPGWVTSAPTPSPISTLDAQADELEAFKHFVPHFPGSEPSLQAASELFVAFAFRKRADAPAPGTKRAAADDGGAGTKSAAAEDGGAGTKRAAADDGGLPTRQQTAVPAPGDSQRIAAGGGNEPQPKK